MLSFQTSHFIFDFIVTFSVLEMSRLSANTNLHLPRQRVLAVLGLFRNAANYVPSVLFF
jgi:hypothetical protein